MCYIKSRRAAARLLPKKKIYIPSSVLRAGDDVKLRTEAEAGGLQMACAVWGRMQLRRQPWL